MPAVRTVQKLKHTDDVVKGLRLWQGEQGQVLRGVREREAEPRRSRCIVTWAVLVLSDVGTGQLV